MIHTKKNYSCYIEILETIKLCGTKWFILKRIIRVTLKYLKRFNFVEPNDSFILKRIVIEIAFKLFDSYWIKLKYLKPFNFVEANDSY